MIKTPNIDMFLKGGIGSGVKGHRTDREKKIKDIDPYSISLKELWKNTELMENYKEGTDASHLINKHCLLWHGNELHIHVLKVIPIKQIKETSEDLKFKRPMYKELKTQAPPVDVTLNNDGTYRLFNGHRRLKSAKSRKEKYIFVEYSQKADQSKLI